MEGKSACAVLFEKMRIICAALPPFSTRNVPDGQAVYVIHSYTESVLKHAHTAKDAVSGFSKEKLPSKFNAFASKVKDAAKV
jgi:hypothetical protein